jgi:hypothetical protein
MFDLRSLTAVVNGLGTTFTFVANEFQFDVFQSIWTIKQQLPSARSSAVTV